MRTNPMSTDTGLSIEALALRAPEAREGGAHRDLRHALAAERVRIRHMCKALACTQDMGLRRRWQTEMEESLARIWEIEQTLRTNATEADRHAVDQMDECLLEAMELARANGDFRAAEIVAMECMALVELRCLRIRHGHPGPGTALSNGIRLKEQNPHEKYQ